MTLPAYAKLTVHEEAPHQRHVEGLAQKKDLIFVRNGDEHTCDEAVSHLRLKLATRATALIPPSSY
ncbi:protein [Escherichia coli]|uniref:Protein n=1 Tax=Escherichia coli TaxID=562 RepID=A0A377D0U3_ECOLX|nr:protein [Escherichia coli]